MTYCTAKRQGKANGGSNGEGDDSSSTNGPQAPPQEPPIPAAIAAGGGDAPAAAAEGGGTYPNPGNFAERLMHVLENEIAKDSLWWLGEQGEAVAVHPEKIQDSPVLQSHFQGNRYSSFIRNLNRWLVTCSGLCN